MLNASAENGEVTLRRCVRDLVALSSLPTMWIKAAPREIADGLAQIVVSVLDAEFAFVVLQNPSVSIVQKHDRAAGFEVPALRALQPLARPNLAFRYDDAPDGPLNAMCVPIGRDAGSILIALCRRPDFPAETEQMLLQVAAQQAAVALERWRVEQGLLKQTSQLQKLIQTSEAVYRFTDRLFRAHSLSDGYAAALDAIVEALDCNRASILIFDDRNVMRFVAWRGLSPAYRKAVEGHSPWKPEDTDVEPICVNDVEATDLPEALKRVVLDEGIRALAFIPLTANGFVVGKFMAYYDTGHDFTKSEVDLALTIARQLGFGIERSRAENAFRAAAAPKAELDAPSASGLEPEALHS